MLQRCLKRDVSEFTEIWRTSCPKQDTSFFHSRFTSPYILLRNQCQAGPVSALIMFLDRGYAIYLTFQPGIFNTVSDLTHLPFLYLSYALIKWAAGSILYRLMGLPIIFKGVYCVTDNIEIKSTNKVRH